MARLTLGLEVWCALGDSGSPGYSRCSTLVLLHSALACASTSLQMFPLLTITHVHAHTPANVGIWFGLHSSGEASFDPLFLMAPGSQKPCPTLPGFCPRTHHSTMIPGCSEQEQEQEQVLPVSHKIVQSLPRCSIVRA